MNDSELIITVSNEVVAEIADNYWVRLEQEGLTPEIPTVSEAVRVIDDLYNIEPCNGTTYGGDPVPVNEDMQPIPPTPEEEFPSVLQRVLSFAACTLAADNSYEVLLRVYRSHNDIPYKLNVTGGEVLQTIRKYEDREDTLLFDNVSVLNLPYPVISTPVFSWNGTVYGTDNTIPTIKGSTVAFSNPVTGQLQVSYRSRYDLVTIKVFAVDGELGDCRVFCFYNKTVTIADIEKPSAVDDTFKAIICASRGIAEFSSNKDIVECYQTIRHLVLCACSGDLENIYETEKIVTCPDGIVCPGVTTECRHNMGTVSVTEYTDCEETTADIADPAFYEKTCCVPPPGSLPKCSQTTSSYIGGLGIDRGQAHYRRIYGDNTRFVGVLPENGICGSLTVEQVKNQRECCDEVAPLVWDSEESVEIMSDNSSGVVIATGGKKPIFVQVRGSGFFLDSGRTIRKGYFSGGVIEVFTGDACGSCAVTMDDGCTSTGGLIKSVDGVYKGAYVYTIISGGKSLSSQIRPGFKYLEVNEGCSLDYELYVWGEMSMSLMVAGLTTWGWDGEFWVKVYEASPTGWVFIDDSAGNVAFVDAVAPRGTDPNIFYPDGPVAPGGIGGYDCGDPKWQCV